jgi:amidase
MGGPAEPDSIGEFCFDNAVAIEGAPHGPLCGLTFAVQDAFHVAAVGTGFGHPDWLRTHEPAIETASVVQLLLDAGAIWSPRHIATSFVAV